MVTRLDPDGKTTLGHDDVFETVNVAQLRGIGSPPYRWPHQETGGEAANRRFRPHHPCRQCDVSLPLVSMKSPHVLAVWILGRRSFIAR